MVTVLMPVRDTPAWMLELAVKSILAQTFAELEFLIVDDGSRSPETIAAIQRAAARDSRVRIETTAGIGCTRALNAGLAPLVTVWLDGWVTKYGE